MKSQAKEMASQYTRFTVEQFDKLLSIAGPLISKKCKRTLLKPEERLLITLRFMETGSSSPTLAFQFRVGKTTETCEAVWNALHKRDFMKPTKENCQMIVKFEQRWNFPHYQGALSGKDIAKAPANSKYQQYFGILLCDDNYKFTYMYIGSAGCESNGEVFTKSLLGNMVKSGQLDLPSVKQIGNYADCAFPYIIVANVVLPLKENIWRLFPRKEVHYINDDSVMPVSEELLIDYQESYDYDYPMSYEAMVFLSYFGIGRDDDAVFYPLQFADEDFDDEDELPQNQWSRNVNASHLLQPRNQLRR